MANVKYDMSLRLQAIEMYQNGEYISQISEQLNVPRESIRQWISKAGISRHRGPKSKIGKEDFFDVIDTQKKAYYLGWLMADGNVSVHNGQYSLKIHISLKDKELIDKFLQDIESTNKTKVKQGKHASYYVSLTSRHMVESLIKLGVIPNKTGREVIPDLPVELIPHFIRGYFDGDGVTNVIYDSGYRSGFVGNKPMLERIQQILGVDLTITPAQGVYYFMSGIEFSKKLYEYMYRDAVIYLKRKKIRMDIICGNTEVSS